MSSSRIGFKEASELYQGMLTASDMGFLILDLNYDILHFSRQAKEMLQLDEANLHFLDYIDLPNTEKAKRMLQTILAEVHISDWEMILYNGVTCNNIYFTGHLFNAYIVLMLKPLNTSVNKLQDVVIQVNSELTNSTRELARKQAQLQKANRQIQQMHHILSEKNELMKQDLRMAKIVQKALLQKVTTPNEKVLLEKIYHPAASVGGDLYDVVNINSSLTGILICDVSGHGVASALVMAVLKNIFRNHAKDYQAPHLFLEKMNQEFLEIFGAHAIELYATAFYMIIDTANHQLHYSGAGQPYPCYYSKTSSEELIAPGFPVGLFERGEYTSHSRSYSPHDRLLLYTDGFTDYLESATGMETDLSHYTWGSIKAVFKQVEQDLRSQAHHQADDVCLMVVEFGA